MYLFSNLFYSVLFRIAWLCFNMLAAMFVSFFKCYYKLLNFKHLFRIILHLTIAIYILLMFLMLYI